MPLIVSTMPAELAPAYVFLASQESSCITGEAIYPFATGVMVDRLVAGPSNVPAPRAVAGALVSLGTGRDQRWEYSRPVRRS